MPVDLTQSNSNCSCKGHGDIVRALIKALTIAFLIYL